MGPTLRWGSGRRCSLGEILRPARDPVGVRVPGDVQREAEYQDIVGQRREAGAEMEETAHGCG